MNATSPTIRTADGKVLVVLRAVEHPTPTQIAQAIFDQVHEILQARGEQGPTTLAGALWDYADQHGMREDVNDLFARLVEGWIARQQARAGAGGGR